MRRSGLAVLSLACSFIVLSSACARPTAPPPPTNTDYQAVLLTSGQLYYGKIGKVDGDYLFLDKVFYVQPRVDSDTKQAKPTLIKRGQEWHSPSFMYIKTAHIS